MKKKTLLSNNLYSHTKRERQTDRFNDLSKSRLSIFLQPQYSHIRKNKKREQLLEGNHHTERYTEIERENRILLEKMHKIMISNKNYGHRLNKSLNISQRVRNQKQISIENFKIVKRLQSKKSFYDFKIPERNVESLKQKKEKSLQLNQSLFNNTKLSPIFFELKRLVLSKNILIENRVFSIEITKGEKKIRIIAKDENKEENYSLELNRNEALILMGGTED